MRYKPEYEKVRKNILNELLEKDYGYSLLNFAFVIADVLAGIPVLSKTICNMKASAIMQEAKCLDTLKRSVFKSLMLYLERFQPVLFDNLGKDPEKCERFLTILFRLNPFFEVIEDFQLAARCVREAVILPFPRFNGQTQPFRPNNPISEPNQVAFIWAYALRKRQVKWRSLLNLITWFTFYLDKSDYAERLDFPLAKTGAGGNASVLKNQYGQFMKAYSWWQTVYCSAKYFPSPLTKPNFYSKSLDASKDSTSVAKVNFYKNKIETVFIDGEVLKVRETIFIDHKAHTTITDLDLKEERSNKGLILSVK